MTRRSALALSVALAACVPNLGPSDSRITSTRILAVRADPAEAKPGAAVTLTALVASPDGTLAFEPIDWSFCSAPRPLTTDGVVSPACVAGTSLIPAGSGPAVTATTPGDGCSVFGPDTPPGGLRPADPDETGGYYQPLGVELPKTDSVFDLLRIMCDLEGASAAAAAEFAAAYVPNSNPELLPLVASSGGQTLSLASVPAGARVNLEASWPAASAETYAYFDAASGAVTTKREAMSVAWYTTGGGLDTESTGRSESDPATTSDNGFDAPVAAGVVHLWTVLRDSRGGVDWASYDIGVVP